MGAVARFLKSQAFAIAILASAAISFAFPEAFDTWCGVKLLKLVVPAIQLIMFGMGTTLSLGDFARVLKRPWAVGIGVFLQFLVMPVVGFVLATLFGFSGELVAGCILVGSVAGGTASNVIAYLAKADVALSVTMTCCSTLLSPFVTPLMMKALAGCFVEIDALKMMSEIIKVILLPVSSGCLVHWLLRGQFERHKTACDMALTVVSVSGICFTLLALTAPSRATFASAGVLIVLAAVFHNTTGYLCGYWLTRLFGRWLPLGEREARTVAIEVGLQNGGMAGALAVSVLNSTTAALPANVFSIWMNFSGSVLANWWSRRPPRPTLQTRTS